jgi:hypothetical protein
MGGGTYCAWTRLKGEELGVENLLVSLGYNTAVREPLMKSVLTYSLVYVIRAIYHLLFVLYYCFVFAILLGIPLLFLLLGYYWIVDFVRGLRTH